ncbi:hypothetical protein PAPYR_1662 [Paratrimastix pyriformis]|uniref:Uncharacterized protein n=1 Tax=Paratrimastix pyriformis TaxID=342808 RepID=A0ABQ8UWL7_9EUKA|nr:hypothetical protein PAPYR_1662 [Paratrimastix pyriformis]
MIDTAIFVMWAASASLKIFRNLQGLNLGGTSPTALAGRRLNHSAKVADKLSGRKKDHAVLVAGSVGAVVSSKVTRSMAP